MTKKILLILIILILLSGVGYYIWRNLSKSQNQGQNSEVQKKAEAMPVPNLDRPLNFPASLPEEAKKIASQKIHDLSASLKQNPNNFDNWLELAIYLKTVQDYEGTKECWEYASYLFPQSYVPFGNLGDLYTYYIKDYKKAEGYFLTAIEKAPNQPYLYRNLYELYRYALKDDNKAKDILRKGIENNPNASDLRELLNSF